MNGLLGSGSGVVGTSTQAPLFSMTICSFDLFAETLYTTPRFTAPGSWPTAGPSHGLLACTCQTSVSRNVAPLDGAGTVAGSTALSPIDAACGNGAAETTRIVTLPPARFTFTSPASRALKHRLAGGAKLLAGGGGGGGGGALPLSFALPFALPFPLPL